MISNERRWPAAQSKFNRREENQDFNYNNSYNTGRNYAGPAATPRPFTPENSLHTQRIQIERKSFLIMLKENARGRFIRITEDLGARSNSIIVPAEAFGDFQKLLAQMVQAAEEIPASVTPAIPDPQTP